MTDEITTPDGTTQTVESALAEAREQERMARSWQNASEAHERNANRANARIQALAYLRNREAREAVALIESHTQLTSERQATLDSRTVEAWFSVAIRAGILGGYSNESHRLANYVSDMPRARDIWQETAESLRDEYNSFPEPVSIEEALAEALKQVERSTGEQLGHPADPRLNDFWTKMHDLANEADFCDVWNAYTLALGVTVERPEPEKVSGTMQVQVCITVPWYVEDVDAEDFDAWDHVDSYDIADAISDMSISDLRNALSIEHIDTDEVC